MARARVGETAATARLAVIAMGKCGGHELNYISDVDVVFAYEPAEDADEGTALRAATQLASHLMRICCDHTREGTHLAGRRQPASRGQPGTAGPHAREPPRLLREVGQDLGVPGAAQGPAGGRRRSSWAATTSR